MESGQSFVRSIAPVIARGGGLTSITTGLHMHSVSWACISGSVGGEKPLAGAFPRYTTFRFSFHWAFCWVNARLLSSCITGTTIGFTSPNCSAIGGVEWRPARGRLCR